MNCQSQVADVSRHFEQSSQAWHEVYRPDAAEGYLLRTRLARAVSLVQRHAPGPRRVLDLGCGCGPASRELAQLGYDVLGVDIAPAMIEQARRGAEACGVSPRCRFVCADVNQLELTAGGFDVIVALGFIEYFDEAAPMLRQMRHWMAPDGILVLQMTNRIRLNRLLEGKSHQRVERNGAGLKSTQYSPSEIADIARACGFQRVDYRGHSLGPIRFRGRFVPGFRAATWLDRRLDRLADTPLGRPLGRLGMSFISVFRSAAP